MALALDAARRLSPGLKGVTTPLGPSFEALGFRFGFRVFSRVSGLGLGLGI